MNSTYRARPQQRYQATRCPSDCRRHQRRAPRPPHFRRCLCGQHPVHQLRRPWLQSLLERRGREFPRRRRSSLPRRRRQRQRQRLPWRQRRAPPTRPRPMPRGRRARLRHPGCPQTPLSSSRTPARPEAPTGRATPAAWTQTQRYRRRQRPPTTAPETLSMSSREPSQTACGRPRLRPYRLGALFALRAGPRIQHCLHPALAPTC
mmetsp:Transcript_14675/g.42229  ORF Transcript_14675/g.42229 Transcript_14675/m.42229 type:complete len:205 (-) Transcript_14675:136-750(-)